MEGRGMEKREPPPGLGETGSGSYHGVVMHVQSVGDRTDLMFARFQGEVVQERDYIVVRTPSNPTFRWGNYLLFRRPPGPGDDERWPRLFAREMPHLAGVSEHRTFGWDAPGGEEGELEAFLARGYTAERSVVLTTGAVHAPPRPHPSAVVRTLRTDDDWAQATRNQVVCRDADEDEEGFRVFKERQMRAYRAMAEAGMGAWFGAFLEDRLVADLGLFVEGGVGRFQQVCTDPGHRRQGLCGTLVHRASMHGFEQLAADTLVLVAESGGAPARIYGSVGFRQTERMIGTVHNGRAG